MLLKNRDKAFRSRDMELYSTARSNLKSDIKEAKAAYKRKIGGHFNEGDPRHIWQGIQNLTNVKGTKDPRPSTSSNLAEELNHFFACFEATSDSPPMLTPIDALTFSLTIRSGQEDISWREHQEGCRP